MLPDNRDERVRRLKDENGGLPGPGFRIHVHAALVSTVCLVVLAAGATTVWFARHFEAVWGALLFVAALALTAGLLTHNHVIFRCCRRFERERRLARRMDRLEQELPWFSSRPPAASAQMLEHMDDSVRRADLLRRIADGMQGLEIIFRPDESLVWISPSVQRICDVDELQCRHAQSVLELLVSTSDLEVCRAAVRRQLGSENPEPDTLELRLVGGVDRALQWITCQIAVFSTSEEGCLLRLSAQTIQAQKQTEQRLLDTVSELSRSRALSEVYLARSNDERLRLTALLNTISLGILFFDRQHCVQYANKAIQAMFGFQEDEAVIGMSDVVVQSRIAPLLEAPHLYLEHIQVVLAGTETSRGTELRFTDGRILTEQSVVVGQPGERPIGRMWVFEDVTEQRRVAERLVELAERDSLTQLYNRRRFHDDLALLLAGADRTQACVGLILFDLDGFKPVNDSFGHQAGDKVLVGVARAVSATIRRNESFYRLGGDEFALLVREAHIEGLVELAARLVRTVRDADFDLAGQAVHLSASVGVAIFPDHAIDEESFIAMADAAMYCAKEQGRNRFVIAPSAEPSEA